MCFLDRYLLKVSDSQLTLSSENMDEIHLLEPEQVFEGNIIHGLRVFSLMFKAFLQHALEWCIDGVQSL